MSTLMNIPQPVKSGGPSPTFERLRFNHHSTACGASNTYGGACSPLTDTLCVACGAYTCRRGCPVATVSTRERLVLSLYVTQVPRDCYFSD